MSNNFLEDIMKKRILSFALALVMALSLAACGGNSGQPDQPSTGGSGGSASPDTCGRY